MKYLLIILLSICGWSVSLTAQTSSVLDRLYHEMETKAAYLQYEFSLIVSGVKTIGSGNLTTQENAYLLEGNGLRISCDGSSVWLMDQEAKEVIVEKVSTGVDSYMSNPVLLFTGMNDLFTVTSSVKNGSQIVCSLSPKTACGVKEGTLVLNTAGEVPVFVSGAFTFTSGEKLDIKIKSMTFLSKKSLTHYSVSLSTLDSSWVVTDLR